MEDKKRVIHIDKYNLGEASELHNINFNTNKKHITYPWFLITDETPTEYTLTTLNGDKATVTKQDYNELTNTYPGCTEHTYTPTEATQTVIETGENLITDAALTREDGTATEPNVINNIEEYFAALLIHR